MKRKKGREKKKQVKRREEGIKKVMKREIRVKAEDEGKGRKSKFNISL